MNPMIVAKTLFFQVTSSVYLEFSLWIRRVENRAEAPSVETLPRVRRSYNELACPNVAHQSCKLRAGAGGVRYRPCAC